MAWDAQFYDAVHGNVDFSNAVTALAYEYKADAVAPFAVYQLINANSINDLDESIRQGDRLIQLTVWASSPTEAKEISEYGIIGAKASLSVTDIQERSLGRDSDAELFGYATDFRVWFTSP